MRYSISELKHWNLPNSFEGPDIWKDTEQLNEWLAYNQKVRCSIILNGQKISNIVSQIITNDYSET